MSGQIYLYSVQGRVSVIERVHIYIVHTYMCTHMYSDYVVKQYIVALQYVSFGISTCKDKLVLCVFDL